MGFAEDRRFTNKPDFDVYLTTHRELFTGANNPSVGYSDHAGMFIEGDKVFLIVDGDVRPIREEGIVELLQDPRAVAVPPSGTRRPDLYKSGAASYLNIQLEVLAIQTGGKSEPEWSIIQVWDPKRGVGFLNRAISWGEDRKSE
jgi:hypothetical protein